MEPAFSVPPEVGDEDPEAVRQRLGVRRPLAAVTAPAVHQQQCGGVRWAESGGEETDTAEIEKCHEASGLRITGTSTVAPWTWNKAQNTFSQSGDRAAQAIPPRRWARKSGSR